MNIESEENIMETLDLKVLGFENDEYASVNGTCYQGVIKTTYDQLVEIFGKPTYTEATHMKRSMQSGLSNQRLSSKMMMTMIISTNHLLFTTGKLVTFLLKSMSGISVVMILRRRRLQTQSLRTT